MKTGIQIQLDPQSEALRFRLRMTGGAGSRIKCGMTKRNVDPQSEVLGFRLRMTRGVSFPYLPFVIPVKTGIQIQLDPQSEALRFRLRMTGGDGSRVSSLVIPAQAGIQSFYLDPASSAG